MFGTGLVRLIVDMIKLPFKYKKSIKYTFKKKGIMGVLRFLGVKYLVADEGGEMAVLNILFNKFPSLTFYPFKLEFEHTTVCNKKCILCEHTYWNEKTDRVNLENFKKIIDQFPNLIWMNVTGEGSGFLNPDFMDMLQYLSARNISINFVDELDFLDEERAKKLIELSVNCIWVSMDGAVKETYEKIKVGCDFDKVVNNIKLITKLKQETGSPFPIFCFRFIVNTLNYHEMPKMVELIHSLNCFGEGSRLEFVGVLKFPEIEQYYMPEIPTEIVEETYKKAKELGVPIIFSHPEESQLPDIRNCSAWTEPYIMMGGYVLPCCAVIMSNKREFLRQHALGNVNEKSFKEIWYSERYTKMRQLIPSKEGKVPILCAGCRAFNTRYREDKYGISDEI